MNANAKADAASYVSALLTQPPDNDNDELVAIWENIIREVPWDTLVIIMGALVGIAQDQLAHNFPHEPDRLEHIAAMADQIRSHP